ncbi:hypothetical protein BsWGS_17419 [Bradybaena similaris]
MYQVFKGSCHYTNRKGIGWPYFYDAYRHSWDNHEDRSLCTVTKFSPRKDFLTWDRRLECLWSKKAISPRALTLSWNLLVTLTGHEPRGRSVLLAIAALLGGGSTQTADCPAWSYQHKQQAVLLDGGSTDSRLSCWVSITQTADCPAGRGQHTDSIYSCLENKVIKRYIQKWICNNQVNRTHYICTF